MLELFGSRVIDGWMSVGKLERRGLSYSPRGLNIRRSRFRIMNCAHGLRLQTSHR